MEPPSVQKSKPMSRAAGLAHDTLAGGSLAPPVPPMFLDCVRLKSTTASSELPPRALMAVQGGGNVVGQPGGKVKFVQPAAAARITAAAATAARKAIITAELSLRDERGVGK